MYGITPSMFSVIDRKDQDIPRRDQRIFTQAIDLFNQAVWKGRFAAIKSRLFHTTNSLLDYNSFSIFRLSLSTYTGIHPVPLDHICGTFGGNSDFDIHFNPRNERVRQRWVSIAVAYLQQAPLECVSLVQVANMYFVQEGHHRISVARALGFNQIDAEITVIKPLEQPICSLSLSRNEVEICVAN